MKVVIHYKNITLYLVRAFTLTAVIALTFLSCVYLLQEKVLFQPNNTVLSNSRYTNDTIRYDGIEVPVLYSLNDWCDTVVLFFHWNWWNIYTQKPIYKVFDTTGVCFFTIEYPWYWNYDGTIQSIEDLYMIWDIGFLELLDRGYTKDNIIVRWYSLWWWVASYIADKYWVDRLVLHSTYTSLWNIAKYHFPFLPVDLLFKYDFDTETLLGGYSWKVLIYHWTEDTIVPYSEWLKNHSIHSESFVSFFSGTHNTVILQSFVIDLRKFLEK